MDTIFQSLPSFLRVSNSRLRSVIGLPLTVAWMSLSLPTMAVSPIGIEPSETGVIFASFRNAMSSPSVLNQKFVELFG